MKTTWRVVYIIYATILLLVVGSLANQRQEQLYFESEGPKALASSNELEKFYFFYGTLGYHTKEPLMIKYHDEFILAFFEVYRENQDLSIFYIMLYPTDEAYDENQRVLYELVFNYGDNKTKTYDFDRFRNMQMYMLVKSNRQAEIPINEIQDLNPDTITVLKKYAVINEETNEVSTKTDEFQFIYSIRDNDIIIKDKIVEFGLDNEKLVDEGIFPKFSHVMRKFSYVFYLSMGAAIISVIAGAYFLFFFRRGKSSHLGPRTPTKAFKDFGYQSKDGDYTDEDQD